MSNLMPWNRTGRNGGAVQSVSRLRSDWDRLFDRMLDDLWTNPMTSFAGGASGMLMDLTESDDEILVTAEIPGVDPKEVEIHLNGDVLTVSGEKRAEEKHQQGSRHYSERTYGAFERSITLPTPVDAEKVKAESKNGVITIKLRKAEDSRSRKIEVQRG